METRLVQASRSQFSTDLHPILQQIEWMCETYRGHSETQSTLMMKLTNAVWIDLPG